MKIKLKRVLFGDTVLAASMMGRGNMKLYPKIQTAQERGMCILWFYGRILGFLDKSRYFSMK
jgi:hypothetical protein